jgi:hypothetical protein
MDEVKAMISLCGIDCARCRAYKATQAGDEGGLAKVAGEWSTGEMNFEASDVVCDGCHGPRVFRWCRECPTRACAAGNGLLNCAGCVSYPCDQLSEAWGKMGESRAEAKANLDGYRG